MPEEPIRSRPGISAAAIGERWGGVRRRIDDAARRSGRSTTDVEVVVVTKGHPPEVVREAYAAGVRHFGENRVEECGPKIAALPDLVDSAWHLIGHLQSRKVKELPDRVAWVHSLDRLKIAHRLDEWAHQRGRPLAVLLECNVSGERSKGGWRLDDRAAWDRYLPDVEQIIHLPNLRPVGLMTMAPLRGDALAIRRVFRSLADLREHLQTRLGIALPHLSMGMTDDFEIAVEEGATLVRVGRAIFGERPPG